MQILPLIVATVLGLASGDVAKGRVALCVGVVLLQGSILPFEMLVLDVDIFQDFLRGFEGVYA